MGKKKFFENTFSLVVRVYIQYSNLIHFLHTMSLKLVCLFISLCRKSGRARIGRKKEKFRPEQCGGGCTTELNMCLPINLFIRSAVKGNFYLVEWNIGRREIEEAGGLSARANWQPLLGESTRRFRYDGTAGNRPTNCQALCEASVRLM